jgi:SHS family sialic acid transporter-like MFS transporter
VTVFAPAQVLETPTRPAPASLSSVSRLWVLAVTFAGLVFGGAQLGLMALVSLSSSRELMGNAYTNGLGGDWFGRYTAAIMLGAACGGIFLGSLGDKIGRARTMGISIVCYSIFGGAGAIVTSQLQLLGLRFLVGLGVGGVWPNGVSLVSECWAGVSRPTAAAVTGTAINVGIFCLSQLGRWHPVTTDSWRWLVGVSGLPIFLGMIALTFVSESPQWTALRQNSQSTAGESKSTSSRALFAPALRSRTIVGICLGSIPLIGAWAASKWMIPWADQVGGTARPGYKAITQGYWSGGAILGSFFGAYIANLLGRRIVYFLISLASLLTTCGIFLWLRPLDRLFLPAVLIQGFVTTLYFGWLPLYLPELFPTHVRAAGTGITYNAGRFAAAAGVLGAGAMIALSKGDYAKVGVVTGLIYAFGMIVVWWAPDTTRSTLND